MRTNRLKKLLANFLAGVFVSLPCGTVRVCAATGSKSDPIIINGAESWHDVIKNIQKNENWSCGKYFSLVKPLGIAGSQPLAPSGDEKHKFCGHFMGNGNSIRVSSESTVFGYIGKGAEIRDLTVKGIGKFAYVNDGTIASCKSVVISNCGVAQTNNGVITDCTVEEDAELTSAGIAYNNYGEIRRCVVCASTTSSVCAGLVYVNHGRVSNCLFCGEVESEGWTSSSMPAGLVMQNDGKVSRCTMRGKMSGFGVYLVYKTQESSSITKKCTVGEEATGADRHKMFGSGYPADRISKCGYEEFGQPDYCDLRTPQQFALDVLTGVEECAEEGAKLVGSAVFGVAASAVDSFIKSPVQILSAVAPEVDFLQNLSRGCEAVSDIMEIMAPNPKVYKVSKIGADIAGLFIGAKGAVTAVTKAGKALKLGRVTTGFSYVIAGEGAALAKNVAFVVDGAALAEAAGALGKGALMATAGGGSGKTAVEDMRSLDEGTGSGSTSSTFGGDFGHYEFKPGTDLDLRGKNVKFDDALDMAFSRTKTPKSEFNITKWAKDKHGKSMPVEWKAPNGAEVSVDLGHPLQSRAPTRPHIGWQTAGKRGAGGGFRGHIFLDDVPINRI